MKALGRNRHKALLGKAAADIFNVLVHAKDFVKNNHCGKTGFAFGLRKVAGELIVCGAYVHHAMVKAVGTSGNGLSLKCARGCNRGSEPCKGTGLKKAPAALRKQ